MNTIQEERIKGYFITAAKDLIRGEGLAVVSARNVAERAGYSYATLYNYFKDIRDLIFSCIEDFREECRAFISTQADSFPAGEEHLVSVCLQYSKFFIQYPGIFDLFYQQKASSISTQNSDFKSLHTFFDTMVADDWQIIKSKAGTVHSDLIETIDEQHKYSLHGLLMMYLNNRLIVNYTDLIKKIELHTRHFILLLSVKSV